MNIADENKAVIRRCFDEVINTGNLEAMAAFVAPNAVDHNAASDSVQGVEGFRQHLDWCALDRAVCDAYGWPPEVLNDEEGILRRLLALNLERAGGQK